ncbi:hypothetical protein DQ238_13635 [Geodermatophilus sp. TF02-6]|uniref:hypothetical protein n=1 Tax=Geodermatophilus sp. TF02-6 TaxID=2250575 RepID=UPI000DEABDE9|nr:hypothetical protein [Geodermatophilus sp. TF02-6]RBY78222.1 hypothetical protein DQ238_13635 [Geodermatophilus sp. TF02-6]
MRLPSPSSVRRLLGRRPGGPGAAGLRVDDAVQTATELVRAGFSVALEPAAGAVDPGRLEELVVRVGGTGLAARCALTVPVDRLDAAAAADVARAAADAGLDVALGGAPRSVAALAARSPSATVVLRAADPGAEARCRALAGGRVRLVGGRGPAADLAFVRCLNVLMAGAGRPGVGTADPRLVTIAGERAAWNERAPDSWEYVMPWKVRTEQQCRLVAGGYGVRVALTWGEGAPAAVLRRPAGRS